LLADRITQCVILQRHLDRRPACVQNAMLEPSKANRNYFC
jgi:hypothetical protein